MKKCLLIITLSLILSNSFGQRLNKGTLFGIHTITVNLKPDVTMDQFTSFFISKVLPEYEKHWIGLNGYLLRSFKDTTSFAIAWQFKSVKARNRYFTKEDKPNDLERINYEKVKPVEEELKNYGTYTVKYMEADDWVVQ
jgi:hypothetical protein